MRYRDVCAAEMNFAARKTLNFRQQAELVAPLID